MNKIEIFIQKPNFNYCKKHNLELFNFIEKYKLNEWSKPLKVTEAQRQDFYFIFGSTNVQTIEICNQTK